MTTRRSLLAFLVLAAGIPAASCRDITSPAAGDARLVVRADLAGVMATSLVLTVRAADIPGALIFNVPVDGVVASGTIVVPAGARRELTAEAFDRTGIVTHRGRTTLDVRAGENAAVSVTLVPVLGEQPLELVLGSYVVTITPASLELPVGGVSALSATVLGPEGNVAPSAVQWATLDPAIARVDRHGVVTGIAAGVTQVVAVCAGSAALVEVSVVGP